MDKRFVKEIGNLANVDRQMLLEISVRGSF